MITRSAPCLRRAAWLAACALVLAACAASNASTWTYVAAAGTPPGSAAPASGGPAGSPTPATGSGAPGNPAASGGPAATTFNLVETASLSITDAGGTQVTTLTVKKGQTYHFSITNSAGFPHNFYVGKVSDLEAGATANLTGTGDFSSGTKEFDYTFSDDSAPLGFGCLIPGHYQAGMRGTFTVQP